MKVLVSGSSGQLARAIRDTWNRHEIILPGEDSFDLGCRDKVSACCKALHPDVIINTGAFTNVDLCETQPDTAMRINGEAVGWLAEACEQLNCLLVQISTDYVFDGTSTRPYRETDPTNPLSAYGRSKLEGERQATCCMRHLIVRTSWLYDGWGRNFFNTMLQAAHVGHTLRVVDDQRGTPTSCRALARQLLVGVDEGWNGLVHATCQGETTWYGFAKSIFDLTQVSVDLSPCTTADFPRPARRPAYSVLDNTHRIKSGPDLMPHWREALSEVIEHPDLSKDS